jgi:seryl-tRNA synthetase
MLFAMQIITGMIAIIATVFTAIGGWYLIKYIKNADPLIQQKIKNKIIKQMFEEASTNAISQLQNQILKNTDKLQSARESRNKMGSAVVRLEAQVKTASDSNKSRMQETLNKLKDAYELVKVNVDKAQLSFNEFEKKVNDYKEMDRFNKDAVAILDMFEEDSIGKLDEMLSLESFNSIDDEFNTAVITIENSANDSMIKNM